MNHQVAVFSRIAQYVEYKQLQRIDNKNSAEYMLMLMNYISDMNDALRCVANKIINRVQPTEQLDKQQLESELNYIITKSVVSFSQRA